MVGRDVTWDGPPPTAFGHHYRWKPAIVHGAGGADATVARLSDPSRSIRGRASPVIYPASGLWNARAKHGGRGPSSRPRRAGDGEDYPGRGRQRHAALPG